MAAVSRNRCSGQAGNIEKGVQEEMAKGLSSEVKQALRDIYYQERTGRGKAAFSLLEKASAAGDGDASCVLARCYCGHQYVWSGHGFPEDDDRATALLHKSVEQGSALGVLVAMRTGELTPELEAKMPFASLQEAFDQAQELAESGDAFCQYVVANSYFWWDFIRIQNRSRESFPKEDGAFNAAYKVYLKENISKCEDLFWKALRGGMYFAANNLNRYYTQGDEDIILPQPEKARDLWKIGAEYGHPVHQSIYAKDLEKEGRKEEAFYWFKQAAEGGEPGGWCNVGHCYMEGIGTPKDEAYAVKCYEKELPTGNITSHNILGEAYFLGKGVEQNYTEAIRLLTYACDKGSKYGLFYLAKCYFNGWGTPQDYVRARQYLDKVDWNYWEADYLRGLLYGNGLGVAADIPKAVGFLQKAGDHPEARAELAKYKKTLFGKWVRR